MQFQDQLETAWCDRIPESILGLLLISVACFDSSTLWPIFISTGSRPARSITNGKQKMPPLIIDQTKEKLKWYAVQYFEKRVKRTCLHLHCIQTGLIHLHHWFKPSNKNQKNHVVLEQWFPTGGPWVLYAYDKSKISKCQTTRRVGLACT